MPAAPPGWDSARSHLIRIVDPLGGAIAWLAPDSGANCVGYAVRDATPPRSEWTHVFCSGGPDALVQRPLDFGCAVLSELRAAGDRESVAERSAAMAMQPWTFTERDPTAAVLEAEAIGADEGTPPARVRLRLTAWLDDAALSLALEVRNVGSRPVLAGAGLRPTFAPGIIPILVQAGAERAESPPERTIKTGRSQYADVTPIAGIRDAKVRVGSELEPGSTTLLSYVPGRDLDPLAVGAVLRVSAMVRLRGAGATTEGQ